MLGRVLRFRIVETYVELAIPANRRIPKIVKSNLFGASDFPCLLHVKGRKIRAFADVAAAFFEPVTCWPFFVVRPIP